MTLLSRVQGIPTFIILDAATGVVVCDDARSRVGEDAAGASFPWRPRSVAEIFGHHALGASGGGEAKTFAQVAATNEYIGLYFSAHW